MLGKDGLCLSLDFQAFGDGGLDTLDGCLFRGAEDAEDRGISAVYVAVAFVGGPDGAGFRVIIYGGVVSAMRGPGGRGRSCFPKAGLIQRGGYCS